MQKALEPLIKALTAFGASWLIGGTVLIILTWHLPQILKIILDYMEKKREDDREAERQDKRLKLELQERRAELKKERKK